MQDATIDLTGIPVDASAPVLVTGASGYLGSWITRALLDAGVTVHAAVRDPGATTKVTHLLRAAKGAPGELRLFAADLLEHGSYAEAMDGTRVVIHTASPFTRSVGDPRRDLVDPALEGTRNVLRSVEANPSVRRVVLTSSVAAVFGDAVDVEARPGGVIDEHQWNDTSSLTREPYSYPKTLAEREAWRIADGQDRWHLVTINPALVIGPALNPDTTSESFTIVTQLIDGTARWGVPRIGVTVVDVREVARAHIAAAFLPGARGRHIVAAEDTDTAALAMSLRPRFASSLPPPSRALPTSLLRVVAPMVGLERDYVRRNAGRTVRADASKSRRELGMRYRPVQESMEDMVEQMTVARTATTSDGSTRAARVLMVISAADRWTLDDGTVHPSGYWAEEVAEPHRIFAEAGFAITIATPGGIALTLDWLSLGVAGGTPGKRRRIEQYLDRIRDQLDHPSSLDEVDREDFGLVFYPGGHGPMEDLAVDETSGALLTDRLASGRPLALLCHAPAALLAAKNPDGTWPFRVPAHRALQRRGAPEQLRQEGSLAA